MTMRSRTIAIVGASVAGAKAAEGARHEGFDGRIVLIGEEQTEPYERPPLSKEILRGEKDLESARVHRPGFYDEQQIELVGDRAVGLDAERQIVRLAGGDTVAFDALVVATGAAPRKLTIPGADLDGIHELRTAGDAARLGDAMRAGGRVAVIGAGWIGSEVAASARQMGTDVMLVEPSPVPLRRVLGDVIGARFARLHADHGVQLRLGTNVVELRGTKAVEAVVLEDGRVEPVDVVVAGIGVDPRTELLRGVAGVDIDNGVIVDEVLRARGPATIFAAGDVANAWHPRYRRHVRVEHWANAVQQGLAAGRHAAGAEPVPQAHLPYFFSDQYDLGLEYVGLSDVGDEVVVRGDLASERFLAFWLRDGVTSAAMHVNTWDVVDDLRAIVGAARRVDPWALQDPEVALADLL